MTVKRLHEVLSAIGPPVTGLELAEIIWLAGYLPANDHGADGPESGIAADLPADLEDSALAPGRQPTAPRGRPPAGRGSPEKRQALRARTARASGEGTDADTVFVPTAPMLRDSLAIQRALRPLKRRVPSQHRHVLDEDATADRAADAPRRRPWVPVRVPARERWLTAALVVDTGPAMSIWQPLADQLRDTLLNLGAFRDLRVWTLADLPGGVGVRATPGGPVVRSSTLVDPTGRQLVVVLSDCSGPSWWEGRAGPALHLWAQHGAVAIAQPLAERLWHRTAAPVIPGRATLGQPGDPNTAMRFTPHDGAVRMGRGVVPVPVMEISADWLGDWAKLVTASAGARDTAVTYLSDRVLARDGSVETEHDLPIDERLMRFQAAASSEAAELAAHIAVAVPLLPVMQLVQQQIMPQSGPAHLAEVLLSGLLYPVDAVPGLFAFVEGARDALLRTLPLSETQATEKVLRQVSAEISSRAGTTARTFEAIMRVADGTGSQPFDPERQPFAYVSAEALRLLKHTAIPVLDTAPYELLFKDTTAPAEHATQDWSTLSVPTARDSRIAARKSLPSLPPYASITTWGPPNTGKTTLIAALNVALLRQVGPWHIRGEDRADADAIGAMTDRLNGYRQFPDATVSIARYRWELVGQAERRRGLFRRRVTERMDVPLDLADAPGGSADPTMAGPIRWEVLIDSLMHSRGILFAFDPVREFTDRDALAHTVGVVNELNQRMRYSALSDGRLPHYVAVCITKFDEIKVLKTAQELGMVHYDAHSRCPRVPDDDAREFFSVLCEVSQSDEAPIVPRILERTFRPDRVRYFVTSAIGFYVDRSTGVFDPDDYQNYIPSDGKEPTRIRGAVHPINVVEPLLWLGRSMLR